MKKFSPFSCFIFILLFAALACSTSPSPIVPTQSVDLSTVIAQTAAVAQTQTALAVPPTAVESSTPTITLTATNTATETPTVTSIFSPTPEAAMISVSVATNCRNGPGKVYDYEGALLIGKTVQILARESTGDYWYIHNPETTDDLYCWIWGKYATITGDVSVLPMYTPPPTPTATPTSDATITPTATATKKASDGSFVVSYNNTDTCSPNWWTDYKLRNNGLISFQSMKITIKDMSNSNTFEKSSNVFTDLGGCSTSAEKDVLDPGDILIFSGPNFSYDPSGHLLRISLTLCTGNAQKGTCVKQNFDVQL